MVFTSREKAIIAQVVSWILAAAENPDQVGFDLSSKEDQDRKRTAVLMALIEQLTEHLRFENRVGFIERGEEVFDAVYHLMSSIEEREKSKIIITH